MVKDRFDFGISAGKGIANNDKIGFVGKIRFGVGGVLNFFGGQESGHRRVDVLIGPGDSEALVAQSDRDRGHGRAANASKMDGFNVGKFHVLMMAKLP